MTSQQRTLITLRGTYLLGLWVFLIAVYARRHELATQALRVAQLAFWLFAVLA